MCLRFSQLLDAWPFFADIRHFKVFSSYEIYFTCHQMTQYNQNKPIYILYHHHQATDSCLLVSIIQSYMNAQLGIECLLFRGYRHLKI